MFASASRRANSLARGAGLRRILRPLAIALSLIVCLQAASGALADGDPASDVLVGSPVFFPYQPTVSAPLQRSLEETLAMLRARGLDLKVAIIGNPYDLGAVPDLFGRPQAYAEFLEQEISFQHPQPLLVVMPAGFGLVRAASAAALAGLRVNKVDPPNGLARSATAAVLRIARAAGKPLDGTRTGSSGMSSGGPGAGMIVGAALVLLLLGGSGLWWRSRRALG